jgi:hypothetical protein
MVKNNSIVWVILLFIGVVFLTAFIRYDQVWLPITGIEYSFKNFIIYNFSIQIIFFLFKILILYLFFKFVFLVFDIEKKIPLFKLLLLAEIVSLLVTKGYLFVYYTFIDSSITTDFVNTYEANASLIAIVPDSYYAYNYIIGFVGVFDIIYILFLTYLVAEELDFKFWKTFKIIGLSYLVLLLLLGVVKTFMTL